MNLVLLELAVFYFYKPFEVVNNNSRSNILVDKAVDHHHLRYKSSLDKRQL